MTDRTYWHVPGARSWHARDMVNPRAPVWRFLALCGRATVRQGGPETADRVPRDGHLCGNCSRIIAARTDVETQNGTNKIGGPLYVPEPVASEQDDWSPI